MIFATLVPAVTTTLAQSDPLDRDPAIDEPFPVLEDARQVGPVRLLPGFEIRNFGYDSNIFNNTLNEVEDLAAELIPSAIVQTRFGHRAALTARQAFGFELFLQNQDQSNITNNTHIRGDMRLGPSVLTGRWEYDKRDLRPSSDLDERPTRRLRTLGLEARWFLSPRTDVAFILDREIYDYEDPDFHSFVQIPDGSLVPVTLGQLLDRTERAPQLRLRWRAFSRTDLIALWEKRDYEFDEPRLGRDSKDTRYALGARTDSTGRIRADVLLGHVDFRPDLEGQPSYQGPYGEGHIAFPLLHRLQAILGYERDLQFSTFDNNLFFTYWNGEAELRVRLFRSFVLQGGYRYGETLYPEEGTVLFPGERRHDKITTRFVGLRFEMLGSWSIDLRIGVREQRSNYPFGNTDEFFIRNGLRRRF